MTLALVVAGNYQQFLYWCHLKGMNPRWFRYVSEPQRDMCGWSRGTLLVTVGMWYTRPWCEREFICNYAAAAGFVVREADCL